MAPTKTLSRKSEGGPVATGAYAERVIAARAATCRGLHSGGGLRTNGNSAPALMESIHLSTVFHLLADVAPTTVHGLMFSRTAARGRPMTPNSASASAIAGPENSRRVSVSRGATVVVALHCRHLYRWTSKHRVSGAVAGLGGPRSCRLRLPWPCSTRLLPGGRLAAPQAGHWVGRTSSAVGLFSSQLLTSRVLWRIFRVLRPSLINCGAPTRWRVCARLGSPFAHSRLVCPMQAPRP